MMVVPVVEIEASSACSDAVPEHGRFSPADFSEPEVALLESELARHADLRLEAAGSVAEPR